MDAAEEAKAIATLTERLAGRFPQIPREHVERTVVAARTHFNGAPIRDFVPLLVEHEVLGQLKAEMQASRRVDRVTPRG